MKVLAVARGAYRAPLPGWSGVLHHVLACCCPSAISVGPLKRLACMLRTQGFHSEDYKANILISLRGVQSFAGIKKTGTLGLAEVS